MSNFIEEINVTPVILSLELEAAVIEHRLEDDEGIYVTEDGFFPFWIRVLKNSGFVGFTTYIVFRNSSTRLDRLELANSFNKRNYMTSSYVSNDQLIIDHVLCFRSGLLKETFIRGCRQYSSAIISSIKQIDPETKILVPLGEAEPEAGNRISSELDIYQVD